MTPFIKSCGVFLPAILTPLDPIQVYPRVYPASKYISCCGYLELFLYIIAAIGLTIKEFF